MEASVAEASTAGALALSRGRDSSAGAAKDTADAEDDNEGDDEGDEEDEDDANVAVAAAC